MQLEDVEQACLKYLKGTRQPAVPVETLERYLEREGLMEGLTREGLLDFLEEHELFQVVPPLLPLGDAGLEELADAGVPAGPRVMLYSRAPSERDWLLQLRGELERLIGALNVAGAEARTQGDADRVRAIMKLQARAETLLERLGQA